MTLREWREKRGLSQSELAKLTDLAPSSISYYEDGKRKPDCEAMVKIRRATKNQVNPEDFL